MAAQYAPKGLIGILTPQANTTVEPELAIICPRGFATLHGRLTSPQPSLEARLVDYFESLDQSIAQFADAPLTALSAACTGASYLMGPAREDALFSRLSAERGIPVSNSAYAVVAALRALNAQRIGLISPYPPSLTQASVRYWSDRGFSVAAVIAVTADTAEGHPIYSIAANGAARALADMSKHCVDAVVILGTGMPSLGPILNMPSINGAPVLSCMLATAWDAVQRSLGAALDAASLLEFIAGTEWRHRYIDRYGYAKN